MIDADEAAFHRAILAQPDEPMQFLVYADWLEERGREEEAFWMRVAPMLEVAVFRMDPRIVTIHVDRIRFYVIVESDPCGTVARVVQPQSRISIRVRADGTSPDCDRWVGWLLALALA